MAPVNLWRSCASACLTLALGACTTMHSVEPAGLANARAQHLRPERAWQLEDNGVACGRVVLFASDTADAAARSSFYSVQNLRGQELGMVDVQGRAWRYEVHQRDARWLATGTLLDGARVILGAGPLAELAERPVEALATGAPAK